MKIAQFFLSRDLIVANIRATYYAATQYPLILRAGLTWYNRANQQAKAMAVRHGVPTETAIGVISALSPRNPWDRNLIVADVCLRVVLDGGVASDFKATTFNTNKEKAVAIARGVNPLSLLNAPKTRAFYRNILNPYDPWILTIDGHALHVAVNKIAAIKNVPALKKKSYNFFASCYREATKEINQDSLVADILPCQVQAVCWQYYRVIKGYDRSFKI